MITLKLYKTISLYAKVISIIQIVVGTCNATQKKGKIFIALFCQIVISKLQKLVALARVLQRIITLLFYEILMTYTYVIV